MFGTLSDKFQSIFSLFSKNKTLTEETITEAVSEVRLALLEADVQYAVAKKFIQTVKEKAVGAKLIKSVNPHQQFVKIVHDALVELMGGEEPALTFSKKPAKLMLCGLQGSGKTTQTVKIAALLKKQGKFKNPCVIACDLQRPAARQQLKSLAESAQIHFFDLDSTQNPVDVAKAALDKAPTMGWDLLLFDTAGRLHIDDALMQELQHLKEVTQSEELLFVANAATGQDAVRAASAFHEKLTLSGIVLTMLDGTSRSGAAISMREVTGAPIKFEGIGEKVEDIQPFHPTSMADRILGMGDTINLVRRAEEHFDEEHAKELEQKLRKAAFSYEDYLKQLQTVKKMGSFKSLLSMLPGMNKLKELNFDDKEFFKVEAIILSMTQNERQERCELTVPRRKRVARGSGTSIDDVNRLHKSFKQAKQFFKNVPNMNQLEKMFGGK